MAADLSWTTRTPTGINNVHTRTTTGTIAQAWELITQLPEDGSIWPSPAWAPMRLSAGLTVGSAGGHDVVRYAVTDVQPGESVTFTFTPKSGLDGYHRFDVAPVDGGVLWTHTLVINDPGPLIVPVVIPLHDAVLEDLFDDAEARMAGRAHVQRPYTARVQALRAAERLVTADPSPSHRPTGSGDAVAATLAAIGVLHAVWARGSSWPASDQTTLARYVVGVEDFPSPKACGVVAGLLGAAAGVVAARNRPATCGRLVPFGVADVATRVVGGVLAIRAAGVVVSLLPVAQTRQFRVANIVGYSPLCAALAYGIYRTLASK